MGNLPISGTPRYIFSRSDGKIQIFSVVDNVQMLADCGKGSSVQNFVAECVDEDDAHTLLDRINVPRKYQPNVKKG